MDNVFIAVDKQNILLIWGMFIDHVSQLRFYQSDHISINYFKDRNLVIKQIVLTENNLLFTYEFNVDNTDIIITPLDYIDNQDPVIRICYPDLLVRQSGQVYKRIWENIHIKEYINYKYYWSFDDDVGDIYLDKNRKLWFDNYEVNFTDIITADDDIYIYIYGFT